MQFVRTRLLHYPHKHPDMHPSPAAVHYYGSHKTAMPQLDSLPHWFLLEESLLGYRLQGDGCLLVIPPTEPLAPQSVGPLRASAASADRNPAPIAPPGLALHRDSLIPLLPRVHRHCGGSQIRLLSAQDAAIATEAREQQAALSILGP